MNGRGRWSRPFLLHRITIGECCRDAKFCVSTRAEHVISGPCGVILSVIVCPCVYGVPFGPYLQNHFVNAWSS